ncbi:hypothetical protein D3C72_1138490 [compost metagenome]
MTVHQFRECLADEARFPRTRDTRHRRETSQRDCSIELVQIVAGDMRELEPACRITLHSLRRLVLAKQIPCGTRCRHRRESVRRPAIEHTSAALTRGRSNVYDPVRVAHGLRVMLDHEQRVAGRLQSSQRQQQRLAVGWMQPGRWLVEHIDHAEQLGRQLRSEPQPLQFARRQGRCAAVQRQIAQSEIDERGHPLHQLFRDALRGQPLFVGEVGRAAHVGRHLVRGASRGDAPRRGSAHRFRAQHRAGCYIGARPLSVRNGTHDLRHAGKGKVRELADVDAPERHRQRFLLEPLAVTCRAFAPQHILRHPLLHQRALRRGKGLQHIAAGARERPLVAGLQLALERSAHFPGRKASVDRHRGLFLGEQDPVTILLR